VFSPSLSIRAVALLFVSCLSETVAFPQAVNFIRHAADPLPLANLPAGRAPCTSDSGGGVSGPYTATRTRAALSAPCDTVAASEPSVNPCGPSSSAQAGCNVPWDPVPGDLTAMGKAGQKILRARERVLEILQAENACSGWFREKDLNPAATFRTLTFEVDRQGEQFVQESMDSDSLHVFHNPYVAKVGQDAGAYATVTLNSNGAFFHSVARVAEVRSEGGPFTMHGARYINVGLYAGDTSPAQVLALLHEFGHVLNLLPGDLHDIDGRSVHNTNEVLRYCRAEIESKVRRSTLSATRQTQ
jgi:hypothetical protein